MTRVVLINIWCLVYQWLSGRFWASEPQVILNKHSDGRLSMNRFKKTRMQNWTELTLASHKRQTSLQYQNETCFILLRACVCEESSAPALFESIKGLLPSQGFDFCPITGDCDWASSRLFKTRPPDRWRWLYQGANSLRCVSVRSTGLRGESRADSDPWESVCWGSLRALLKRGGHRQRECRKLLVAYECTWLLWSCDCVNERPMAVCVWWGVTG